MWLTARCAVPSRWTVPAFRCASNAVMNQKPKETLYELEKAVFIATRSGPGRVIIPLDYQGKVVEEDSHLHFAPPTAKTN